jgi:2-iminobutanoate/2-iminopropanoate deaminase
MFTKYTVQVEVKTDKAAAPVGGMYSQGVVVGGFLHTAGCIGLPAGSTPAEFDASSSIEQQTEIALNNLQAVLTAANCTTDDVVKTTVFLADIDDAKAMNGEYKKVFFGEGKSFPPARSMVAVAKLPLGAKMEIEAVAALPMN